MKVIAAEDIVTPDGTVRAAAGEVVDTITTDEEGKAETKNCIWANTRLWKRQRRTVWC